MTNEVLVVAVHPVLGNVYWSFCWGGDCNSVDHFGVTDIPTFALRLAYGWRQQDHLAWEHSQHITKVFDPEAVDGDYAEVDEPETGEVIQRLSGVLACLQSRSGQTVEEFRRWMFRAEWVDIPALMVDSL